MAQGNQNGDGIPASSVEANEDLLVLFLIKLPVKHLLRIRSVSKRWLSIIGGQHFWRLHFKSGSSGGIYFLYLKHPTILDYVDYEKGYVNAITHTNLQNLFAKNQVFRVNSCNGLIALVTDDTEPSLGFKPTAKFHLDFFVYNPATRRCKHIPRPRFDLVHDDLDMDTDYYRNQISILAPPTRFTPAKVCPDSRKRFIALNLAFDPLQSDHYKLVYIWKGEYSDRFAIYDSATRVWKDCECMRPILPLEHSDSQNEFVMYMNGVFWNGDLHWPSYGWSTYCLGLDSGREKPMPPLPTTVIHSPESDLLTGPDMFFFGVADGDLCVIGLKEPLTH